MPGRASSVRLKSVGRAWCRNQQVDLVDTELGRAFLEAVKGLVVAVVADPDLGFNEDVIAGDAGAGESFADLLLVAVSGGSVDVPVAGRQGRVNSVAGLVRGGSERHRIRLPAFPRHC